MLKIVEAVKQAAAAAAASFTALFPSAAILTDLGAAKAALIAALGAGFGLICGFVGNLVKQAIERARGLLDIGYEEIAGLLDEAEGAIKAAKNAL